MTVLNYQNIIVTVLVIFNFLQCNGIKLTFTGCNTAGWKCVPIHTNPVYYRLEHMCTNDIGVVSILNNIFKSLLFIQIP